jgi:hypothetical protein
MEVDRPVADPVPTDTRDPGLARQVEQRPEQEDGDPVEPAELQWDGGAGRVRRGDGEAVTLAFDGRADRPQDLRRYLDVTDVGDVGDRARLGPEQGGHHVLGHGVFRAVDRDLAVEGSVGLDQPGV